MDKEKIGTATISSFTGFHRIIEENRAAMYRGVSNASFELIPKVGRGWKMSKKFLKHTEKSLLKEFKIKARRHIPSTPPTDLEWLAICQHYGASTRLLDWTKNPLVALYFASKGHPHRNGAVYISFGLNPAGKNEYKNPFDIENNYLWEPEHITERFSTQSGIFTLSADPRKPIYERVFFKIIVRSSSKDRILASLLMYGVNQANLFPGLSGIAQFVNREVDEYAKINDEEIIRKVLKERLHYMKNMSPINSKYIEETEQ